MNTRKLLSILSIVALSVSMLVPVVKAQYSTWLTLDQALTIWSWDVVDLAWEVTVTARVLPYLNMTLTWTSIDFWDLNLWTLNVATDKTEISANSNAREWFNVVATYAQLSHVDWDLLPFSIRFDAWANIATAGDVLRSDVFTGDVLNATIEYTATPASNQKAWNYETTVTYTITGNF